MFLTITFPIFPGDLDAPIMATDPGLKKSSRQPKFTHLLHRSALLIGIILSLKSALNALKKKVSRGKRPGGRAGRILSFVDTEQIM